MNVLSLFTGIGAHDLGLCWAGMRIVGQCEIDPYCNQVLEKHWPGLPRWRDIKDVAGDVVRSRCGAPDLITGGFPCQDISAAGKGAGLEGKRSGLFFELLRVIRECRPAWVLTAPGLDCGPRRRLANGRMVGGGTILVMEKY